jgi:hypothetical protein
MYLTSVKTSSRVGYQEPVSYTNGAFVDYLVFELFIGNSMILGFMEVLAEAQILSEKSSIGAVAIHNLVKGTTAPPIPYDSTDA